MPERPRVAITVGDPNGIGPEVVLKCLQREDVRSVCTPVLVGPEPVWRHHAEMLGVRFPEVEIDEPEDSPEHEVRYGTITATGGDLAMKAVARAVALCRSGECAAMATAPISKEAIGMAGYTVPGHTEFLSELCGGADHLMMMVAGGLRVGVVTGHIPLAQVSASVTTEAVARVLRRMNESLISDFGVEDPQIAVLGLNPHAGDGGVLGEEESTVIRPAMKAALPVRTFGPFPADGFFAERMFERFDGVLAMYHDQGLIPFKTLAFDTGINFTAGLPIVRTSPDHGTAFGIAGTRQARPESMANAILVAVDVARARGRRAA